MILVFGLCSSVFGFWRLVVGDWFCFKKNVIFAASNGEMAERSNAAVLKTVEGHTSGGSNPSLSAEV